MKYHYVYRITNKELNKHYYGVRSSKVEPKSDLGIKYFSSSKDKEFINEQKVNFDTFKYKVIKIFETREEAINLEIKLHAKFDVVKSESFYNRSKQLISSFDTSGREPWNKGLISSLKGIPRSEEIKLKISQNRKGIKQSEEHRIKNSESKKGMIYIYKDNKAKKVYPDNLELFLNDGWIKGKLPMSEETKLKIKMSNTNKCNIHNNVEHKVINKCELEEYLNNGWVSGLLPRSPEHCKNISLSLLKKREKNKE